MRLISRGEMIRAGKSLLNGNHPNLRWIHGRVEEAPLRPPYDMITAGFEYPLDGVERRFSEIRGSPATGGHLVIIDEIARLNRLGMTRNFRSSASTPPISAMNI